jgi:hypothetical protein
MSNPAFRRHYFNLDYGTIAEQIRQAQVDENAIC